MIISRKQKGLIVGLVVFSILLVSFGLFANTADAAALVKCGRSFDDDGNPISWPGDPLARPCETCDILVLVQDVLNFILFTLVPAIATLLFIIAGFMIMLGTTANTVSEGRSIFTTTVLAIAIMFGAWMLTNFVITTLAKNEDVKNWHTLECVSSGGYTNPVDPMAFANKLSKDMEEFNACLSGKLSAIGVPMRITSTTDNNIATGACNPLNPGETFNSKTNCQHSQYSCHYGGRAEKCQKEGSYAIDLGDEEYFNTYDKVAKECNWRAFILLEDEGESNAHVHISIGNAEGCGCDK
ncbi:MAG: hypothetical protein ABH833_04450 [Parcubacteria group bacterium]